MSNTLLKLAYAPEDFRKRGHALIDQLTAHLDDKLYEKSGKAINWVTPETELQFWQTFLKEGNEKDLFDAFINRTTYVHHPKYIGHQVSPTVPITALTATISGLLNNGMAVYEMGMSPSAIERVVTDIICEHIGYTTASAGFLTSGGTLANLTALLSARKVNVAENVWQDGSSTPLGILVSEEAHYCVDRAARIMGLGEKGIIKVPVTPKYCMDITQLETQLQQAKANGIQVFAIVGSAPSTATGMYDNLDAIGDFAKKHNLWFHVDGAHGGAAIFSNTHKHLVHGIEKADSVVIDGHKMMMMPTITTALLFKNGKNALQTFSQKADYLLTQSEHEEWYHSGKKTFECTKTMMSLHWYTLFKLYGAQLFNEYVTNLYNMGHTFAKIIAKDSNFELALSPACNIVCFRYMPHQNFKGNINSLNEKIREILLQDGEFYIVQTKLKGVHYLRTTIMNPFTTEVHLQQLLDKIKNIADTILKQKNHV